MRPKLVVAVVLKTNEIDSLMARMIEGEKKKGTKKTVLGMKRGLQLQIQQRLQ